MHIHDIREVVTCCTLILHLFHSIYTDIRYRILGHGSVNYQILLSAQICSTSTTDTSIGLFTLGTPCSPANPPEIIIVPRYSAPSPPPYSFHVVSVYTGKAPKSYLGHLLCSGADIPPRKGTRISPPCVCPHSARSKKGLSATVYASASASGECGA